MEPDVVVQKNRSHVLASSDDVERVDAVALGRPRIITPAGESWDSWFDGEGVTEDFMHDRDQPADQEPEVC